MSCNLTIVFGGVVLLLATLGGQATPVNNCPQSIPTRHFDEGKLIFSHLLWRHGDRTPGGFVPNDPYQSPDEWPVGFGQLTNLGKQQHYNLGKWLRHRYNEHNFLPREYSEQDIYVRSTDYDRTLASAYSNLAGLYPPSGVQIWNKQLLWQPIPVHTVPDADDYILSAGISGCPAYQKLFDDLMASDEMTQLVAENRDLIDYIDKHAGTNSSTTFDALLNALIVRDNFLIENIYDKALPPWGNAIYKTPALEKLGLVFYLAPAYNEQLARFRVGYFFQEILNRSAAKAAGTLTPDRKVWVYSAHDINISTVLYGLGLFDGDYVQYAAALLFELRKKSDGHVYFSISYRKKSTDDHAIKLCIPGCGHNCKLSDIFNVYKDILPTQSFKAACQL